jgi:hypothetical protein
MESFHGVCHEDGRKKPSNSNKFYLNAASSGKFKSTDFATSIELSS